jgi:MtrB/PioB family decaheme-associated outer membrane protein
MHIARSLKAMLAAGVCLLPLQALAQSNDFDVDDQPAPASAVKTPDNWVTLGVQYKSAPGAYLGRFQGSDGKGLYGIGDFQLRGSDPRDSGGTRYWDVEGRDLGFDDRSFIAKFGQQGTWGVQLSYDGIPYRAVNGFKSVWDGSGHLSAGLGGTLIPLAYPSTPLFAFKAPVQSLWQPIPDTALAGQLVTFKLGTQRDIFAGNVKYQWNDWTITGSLKHEHKTGYQANSLTIGGTPSLTTASAARPTSGVTSALGYFAQPIDYDTDRYDLTAALNTQRMQFQVGYTFHNFTDNLTMFNAQNAFGFNPLTSYNPAGSSAVTAASIFAPYSLPPSNSAHQFRAMFGYNVTPTTRVNANFQYGLQLQNDTFQTATGNPAQTISPTNASYNGVMQNLYGNVSVTSQLMDKVDVRLAYTIDNRDNQSPGGKYAADWLSNYSASPASYTSIPFSYNRQALTGEVGYKIAQGWKLTATNVFETTYRSYANASWVTQDTGTLKLRGQLADDLYGAISYSHQDRNAHTYNNNYTWTVFGDTARDPAGFYMYFETSRKHDEIKTSLDYAPVNSVNVTLMAKAAKDTYPGSTYGLRNNNNFVVGPDVSWQVTPTLSTHAFYSYQSLQYEQASLYESSTTAALSATTGYAVPWTNKTTDDVHTAGISADWQAIKDVLKITADYTFAYGNTAYAMGDSVVFLGSAVVSPVAPTANAAIINMANDRSMLSLISIRGEYTIRPDITLLFGYAFERFTNKDPANGYAANTYANVILPGTSNYNEAIHVVGAGMRIRF